MKSIMFLGLALVTIAAASPAAYAKTETYSDRDSVPARADIPLALVSGLRMAGFKFKAVNGGNYVISVKNLNCSMHSNGSLDPTDPEAYISTFNCRYNSDFDFDSGKGKLLTESADLLRVLSDDLQLADCAMGGKCSAAVKSINCVVDTKVEQTNGFGRYSCSVEDTFE